MLALPCNFTNRFIVLLKITTGSGNDHITASALSLRNVDGSSVDVGTGTNRLSLDWGTGVTLTPGLLEEYFEARYPVSQTRDTGSDSTASMAEFIAGNTGKTVPTVTVGSRINGTLNNDDDLDTYAVFLEAGKTYQLSFFSGEENGYSGIDLDFFAYDSQKNAITTTPFEDEDKDSTGVDNGEQRIFTPTTSGIYYFEVGPHGDDTGVYGFEVEELGTDSQVLDFTDIDFSGNLHQLDILNDVALFPGTTSNLNMPGGTDNVSILTFTDLVVGEDEGTGANLNIKGASNDFTILSDGDFTLGEATGNAEVIEGLGTLSVMNAAGVEITGALHVEAESDVAFRVGNNALESLSVSAIDNDAVIRVGGNTSESFTINAINIDAGGDAYVFIDNNDSSKLSLGAVSITSEDDVDLNIWENKNTDITFSSINVEADEDGSIYLSYNELYDSDDDLTTNDMKIVVSGPIDLYADGDAYFEIGYNYESSVDRDLIIDIQSSVSVTSEDEKSIVYVGRNDDVTLNFKGMFEVSTNSQFGDYAWMDVSYNNNSTIRFEDTVTVSATGEDSDVYFYIQDNDNGSVRFNASVLIDSDDYAEFRIQDNVSASVRLLGGVNIEAGSDIDIDILYNDDQLTPTAASVLINGITAKSLDSGDVELYIYDNDYAVVRTGNVSLTSLGFDSSTVSLEIISNDDSEITLGSVDMSGNYVHLDIYGNDSSAVSLDDVMMIANDSDVYFYVHSAGEDSISIKDVTARAYDDIWFYAANQSGNDSEVRLGNINLRAGAELAEGDTFTNSASWDADVYLYLDTVEGTETIHLQTNAGEDSDIDAYINNTPDLHTVTLVGAGANETSWLQIYGEQGNDAGVFTIDLSGLNSSAWVRTVTNDINNFRDNVDMFADFDTGTVVKVLIGASSTVEYNVESVGTSYLFSGSSSGYVSTGVRDLTPVIEVLRINGFEGTQSNHVNYSSWNSTDSITVNFGGAAYVFTNQFGEGTWSVSGPNGVDTFAEFADAIGATYVGIIDSQLSIEGAYDGSDIPAITSIIKEATIVYYVYDDEDFGGGYDQFVTSNTSIPSYSVTLEGVMVTDGKGLVDREVFTFTGNDVGSVVIGGFNPGAWNTVSPINGQVTDRLDFSQFSKVSSLDDMIFTIENTGPFANVVIDFVDTDLGSVTLVGVGQYADAIALVQGSIMFS